MPQKTRPKKYFARFKEPKTELPNLVESQITSFDWIMKHGLKEIFKEFSPIKDYSEKKFELEFVSFEVGVPKFDEHFAKDNKLSFEAPLRAMVRLKNKAQNSVKEQEVFMADFPLMTPHGTFIINGVERVIVPQLARSFGVFFTVSEMKGKEYFGARIIPSRGAWIEIDSEPDGAIYVRVDRRRKFPASSLLRVLGAETDEQILKLAKGNEEFKKVLEATIAKDTAKTKDEAYIEIYKRMRDGDLATVDNARNFINSIFEADRYDLSRVGRFRFNKRFGHPLDEKALAVRTLSLEDLTLILSQVVELNITSGSMPDDIDHLGSRRVRYVGEMLQQKMRVGMARMKRNIQDRMSTIDVDATLPIQFLNPRPFQAGIKEFFTTNQLSQFMPQTNILEEIESLRTLSALGPGGLTRERAGFEVRDVHPSHYGRLCPIHTPEGPNIGLILRLSTFARFNEFSIIETPYAKVVNGKVTKETV